MPGRGCLRSKGSLHFCSECLVAVEMDHWESECRAGRLPGKQGLFALLFRASWGVQIGGKRSLLHRECRVLGTSGCFEVPCAGPDVTMATSSSWVAWDHPAFCTESPEAGNPGSLGQTGSG